MEANEQASNRANLGQVAALLGGNAALALGPYFVRLSDTGAVASGFWRLFLAMPVLLILALREPRPTGGHPRALYWSVLGAGMFFALDLGSWHIGIERTRLGNASLFGNAGSVLLILWGLIALGRRPTRYETAAITAAFVGSAILLGRSLEIDPRNFTGDLFCILAGVLYTGYILLIQRAREQMGNWTVLAASSATGVPVLLAVALMLGERIVPHVWWPVILLAISSQLIGQGLLVYALKHFPPMVVGMALLTQPAISALVGWAAFGEVSTPLDIFGMALIAAALVLSRGGDAGSTSRTVRARN